MIFVVWLFCLCTHNSPENILSEVILANPLGHVIPRSGGKPAGPGT